MKAKTPVLSREVAIKEVINFVEKWDERTKTSDQVEESYPDIIDALVYGNLTIDEDLKASYKLTTPVLNDKQEIVYDVISFKTRIKPKTLSDITKGMNIAKEQHLYLLKCLSYITGIEVPIIDNLSKTDYRVLDQLSTIFL